MFEADRLELYEQLKSNMCTLASSPQATDAKALENLIDAYIMHSSQTGKDLSPLASKLSASVLKSLSVQSAVIDSERLSRLADLLRSSQLSFISADKALKNIDTIRKALDFKEKLAEQISAFQSANGFNEQALAKLLRSAATIETQQKTAAKQQKQNTTQQNTFKAFLEAEVKSRLSKKAQRTPDEEYILQHAELLSEASLGDKDGTLGIRLSFPNSKSLTLRVYTKGSAYLLGVSEQALKNKKLSTDIYKKLKETQSISFASGAEEGAKTTVKTLKEKDFKQLLGVEELKLDSEQKSALKQELSAYNHLNSAGKADKLAEFTSLLRSKYQALAQSLKQQAINSRLSDLDKIIKQNTTELQHRFQTGLQSLSADKLLGLIAPGSGQNKQAQAERQYFEELMSLCGEAKTQPLAKIRTQVINAIQQDGRLWTEVSANYYDMIKERAKDPYYLQLSRRLLSDEISLPEALKEISPVLSSGVAKQVLLRSLEVTRLGADKIPDTKVMDKLHNELGFNIRYKQFKVAADNSLRSKPLTVMLRCLADGKPFSLHGEVKFDARDRLYITKNKDEYRYLLGDDANFEPLVGNVLEGKDVDTSNLALTPYQKAYKTLGLLGAINPQMNTDKMDDLLFSMSHNIQSSSLASLKARHKWNRDDFLFQVFMDVFHEGASFDNITQAKQQYGWDKFKQQNRRLSDKVCEEFVQHSPFAEKLVSSLTAKGQWSGDEENTMHHNDPLKYAVASASPSQFNVDNRLVVTVQWKPWEPDFHKLEHLGTIEGLDSTNPYLIDAPEGGLQRRPQCDLRKGTTIYCEKLQVKNPQGKFEDVIPDNTLLLTSQGTKISYPQVPEVSRTQQKTYAAELSNKDISR